MKKNKISVVVPCYNEEENVEYAYDKVSEVLKTMPSYDYEILFIDNCSEDKTADILRKIAKSDKKVKVILNNRNFGPEQSGFHALTQASGDLIIGMACDMQDPPELIPDFVKKWEAGAKVVFGQKVASEESKFKFFLRSLYYKIIKILSPLPQYEHVTGFGLLDKEVIREAQKLNDPWPLMRNIVPLLGYKPEFIQYEQPARHKGKSSYNFFRYFDTALNSLVHTSVIPLKMAIWLGAISSFITLSIGIFYLVYKIFHWNDFILGLAPLIVMLSFLASLVLLFLGILGEYLLLVLRKVNFSGYVVEKERINFDVE